MSSYDYGHNTPDDTPSGKKQTESDVLSWVLIIVCFAIFWPLGLFLLIRKLTDSKSKTPARRQSGQGAVPPGWSAPGEAKAVPNKQQNFSQRMAKTPSMKRGSRMALKVVGAVLLVFASFSAFGTVTDMIFYPPIYQWDVMALLREIAVIGAGGLMLGKGISMDRAVKRYSNYLAIMGNAASVSFHQLAETTGRSEKKVIDDLDHMLEKGYFGPTAYLDLSLGYFFRSRTAADQLAETTGRSEKKVIDDLDHMLEKGYFGPTAYLDLSLGYFFRSRTAAENTAAQKRAEAATPKEAEEGYTGVLRDIRRANDRIADEGLSSKIDRLEEITAQIFRVIEKDSKKEKQVRTFLEYYLPTTQKLLDSYAEFEAAGVNGENLRMAKEKIEETMDNIICGFERQLDALYAAEAMDIQSDIDVMNNMMKRDSAMGASDFKVSAAGASKGPKLTLDPDGEDAAAATAREES